VSWEAPEILSMQAIESDLWDRREHRRTTKGMRKYSRARNALFKVAKTGPDALVDAFMVLTKANPQLARPRDMQPTHLLNRLVIEELLGLTVTRRLRAHTIGDPTQAALECLTLAPILEAIFERLKVLQQQADELQTQLAVFRQILAGLQDLQDEFDALVGDDPSPADIDAMMAMADKLREARRLAEDEEDHLDRALQNLLDDLSDQRGEVRDQLRDAIEGMANEADTTASSAKAWGLSPGELRQLSPNERLKMARQLNNERMREIAELFGRLRSLSFLESSSMAENVHEEIVDLELGADLGRVLPSELLLLGDPVTETDFLVRWSERQLLQYSMQGTDELGRGGIVICIDGSGSMHGSPEIWAKAVMLNLLHTAREQRREMHVIHFGGPGQFKHMAFEDPSAFTAERIFEAAGAFFGGGTDFQTPLEIALGALIDEHSRTGATRADVVFVTDDECAVSPKFLEHYLAEMHRLGARTYGLSCRGYDPYEHGALMQMCEGRVATVKDLHSGKDVSSILRQIRR
jgi:uncharacterized protein with von Willebrand factor type A (vWA) domain